MPAARVCDAVEQINHQRECLRQKSLDPVGVFSPAAVNKAGGMFVLLLSDQMTDDQGEDRHTETKEGEPEPNCIGTNHLRCSKSRTNTAE